MTVRTSLLLALVSSAVSGTAAAASAQTEAPPAPSTDRGKNLPVVLGGIGGAVVLGVAALPSPRRAVRQLFGRQPAAPDRKAPSRAENEATAPPSRAAAPPPSPAVEASAKVEGAAKAEKFALTPEKLATIAELNPKLEEISAMLGSVPVFTAAVGNGTSPLTVPSQDGSKLAYFFTEQADAEAFLRAVKANAGSDLDASVIGVALTDIIKAYSSPQAKGAKETFVLIPTMAEVAAARQLMRAAGNEESVDSLGPHSGLVPVFWSESLAVQTAAGKQRKVLFFRVGDLQTMWANLVEAREKQEEDGEDGEPMPEGPIIQVSDLQTMAGMLSDANKTDDVMFLPSSAALKAAQSQGGEGTARARSTSGAAPAAVGGETSRANADGTAAETGAADISSDDPVAFDGGEDEEAGGMI